MNILQEKITRKLRRRYWGFPRAEDFPVRAQVYCRANLATASLDGLLPAECIEAFGHLNGIKSKAPSFKSTCFHGL
jgi:hypothetical protein